LKNEEDEIVNYILSSKTTGFSHGIPFGFFSMLTPLFLNSTADTDNTAAIEYLDKALNQFFENTGYHSSTDLKRIKNAIIGSCYLLTHFSIRCQADAELSYNLSDYYITKVDQATSLEQLRELSGKIIISYRNIVRLSAGQTHSYHINRCLQYISNNLHTSLRVNEICSFMNLSPEYLSMLFKKEMGIGLYRYIEERKCNDASLLLQYTTLSVGNIAETLGYGSIAHFSKSFKHICGKTPSSFRRDSVYQGISVPYSELAKQIDSQR